MSAASALAFAPTPAALAPRARDASSRPPLSRHDGPRRANWHRRLRSPRAAATAPRTTIRPPADSASVRPDTARAQREPPRRRPPRGRTVAVAASASRVILPGSARAAPASARRPRRRRFPHESPSRPHHPRTLVVPSVDRRGGAHPRGGWGAGGGPMGLGTWSWGNQLVWGSLRASVHGPRTPRRVQPRRRRGHQHLRHRGQLRPRNGFDGRSEVLLGEFLRGCPDRAPARRWSGSIASRRR